MAKYYYNGVLLPEIPSDVLTEYPYAFIYYYPENFRLCCTKSQCYWNGAINLVDTTGDVKLFIYNETEDVFDVWETIAGNVFSIAINEEHLLWTNTDILNGSADATDIYMYNSVPHSGKKYYYNGVQAPELPIAALSEYPYCLTWSLFLNISGYVATINQFIFSKHQAYVSDIDSKLYFTEETEYVMYMYDEELDAFIFNGAGADSGGLDIGLSDEYTICSIPWSNTNVLKGSADSTEVYLKGSDPYTEDTLFNIKAKTMLDFGNIARTLDDTNSIKPLTIEEMKVVFGNVGTKIDTLNSEKEVLNTEINNLNTEISTKKSYFKTFLEDDGILLLELPNDLETIRDYAFAKCNLSEITALPDSLTSIGIMAFGYCALGMDELIIPAGVTKIGTYAFQYALGPKTITFKGTPTEIAANAFTGTFTTINVPWAEGAVANAPWGATDATINYNYEV